jgi:hypothetical protein
MIGGMDVKSLTRPPSPPRPKESTIRPLGGAPREESKEAVFNQPTRETWVDPEELTAFKVADNRILELEREIGAFGGLRSIDVRHTLYFIRYKGTADSSYERMGSRVYLTALQTSSS